MSCPNTLKRGIVTVTAKKLVLLDKMPRKKKGKKPKTYSFGLKCFARLRGFRPWPASVFEAKPGRKYVVKFYGTNDHATVNAADIFPITKVTIEKYGKKMRGDTELSRGFVKAMEELQNPPVEYQIIPRDEDRFEVQAASEDMECESPIDDVAVLVRQNGEAYDGEFFESSKEDQNRRQYNTINFSKSNLAELIEEGVEMDDFERMLLESKTKLSEKEEEDLRLARLNKVFQKKFEVLTQETLLVELVRNLRVCFPQMHKPYLGQAIEILQRIYRFPLTKVLIYKVTNLFTDIEQCRRYEGVRGLMDENRKLLHDSFVTQIRNLSQKISLKILEVLEIPYNDGYSRQVENRLNAYSNQTSHLTNSEKILLTSKKEIRKYCKI